MRRHIPKWLISFLVLSILFVPQIGRAQSSLSLIDQLREIDAILTADMPANSPGYHAPILFRNFKTDPWNNPAPTEKDIKNEFGMLGVTLGPAQSAAEGTTFFPESAVISGLTDFVVNRAKDEVSISFLIGLRNRIAADPLLKILFKQTLVVASQLEANSAKQLLLPLRAAITADVRAIPEKLLENDDAIEALKEDIEKFDNKVDKDKLQAVIDEFKKNRAPLKVFGQALLDAVKGVPPLTTVANYADLTPASFADPAEVRYALITVGTAAREYRRAPQQTKQYLTDPAERDRFLALLIRDLKITQGGETAKITAWASNVQSGSARVSDVVASIEVAVHTVDNVQGSFSDAKASETEAFADVANGVLQLIAVGRSFVTNPADWDKIDTTIAHLNKLQTAVVSRDYVAGVAEMSLFLNDIGLPIPTPAVKSLTFGATLASAKTSEEVTAAIEAAAVPVLSYRVKRTRSPGEPGTWVGINAYVGGAFGREHTTSSSSDHVGFGGLSVPIGIEGGAPLSTKVIRSFSVFAPLIDVGTVASFRLSQSDTKQTPALTWSQIVAPGGYVMFGLTKNYPISVGAGAQFVPKFRRDTASNSPTDVVRYGIIIAIDVPIFRF